MSIATEMTNLAANRDAIKAAIEAKNPQVAPTNALSSFPASIASIPTGGGGGSPVAALYGWPDIKALMAADTEDFAHKAYVLFNAAAYPKVQQIASATGDYNLFGGVDKAITSDGAVYTSAATHTWDASKLIDGLYGWIAFYSSSGFDRMNCAVNYTNPQTMPLWVAFSDGAIETSSAYGAGCSFQYGYALAAIDLKRLVLPNNRGNRLFFSCNSLVRYPEEIDISDCTNTSGMFAECFSLEHLPAVLDISSSTNTSTMFYNCKSLIRVPAVLDTSHSTNCSSMFGGCYSLVEVPDVLDFRMSTNNTNAFNQCYGLLKLPTHLYSNYSISFQSSIWVTDKDSVATFTGGAITDGFVGNLNTCPNNGQTITLNSAIKGLFTASEQSAIEAAVTAKNWTLSW